MDLVFHPASQHLVSQLSHRLPQSLLMSGPKGVGLNTAAHHLARSGELLAVIQPQNIKEQVDNELGTISVESIRKLYAQTQGKHSSRQIVIIDNADRMNTSSQSAFLKLLEEPNDNIHFILTSHTPSQLKSTIMSRVQHSVLQPITDQQTTDLLTSLSVTDPTKQAQLRFIGAGLPAELTRLATDDAYFGERATSMGAARTFLQASTYDRLLVVQQIYTSRDKSQQLVDDAVQIVRRSLSAKPQPALITQLEGLLTVRERLQSNCNVRLSLASLVL